MALEWRELHLGKARPIGGLCCLVRDAYKSVLVGTSTHPLSKPACTLVGHLFLGSLLPIKPGFSLGAG